MNCVVSVLGKDRKGIVAAVSKTLCDCDTNIVDISQTILGEMFSMTMLVCIDTELSSFNKTQEALQKDGENLGLQVTIQRQDLFDSMYKI